MLLSTASLIIPIVVAPGFDTVGFGILLMVVLETELITPLVGINLYVVQDTRKPDAMTDVMIGAALFVIAMVVVIILLRAFSQIALWLSSLLC